MCTVFLICLCILIAVAAKPNFLVILTDDQDLIMNGMKPMRNVHQHVSKEGAVFLNSFVSTPICCPSRASILTGMYQHNHKTINNSLHGGCYGKNWREQLEYLTFTNLLHQNGYQTFYAGKYLNQYGHPSTGGARRVPPGWSEWHGLVGNSVYYNYNISVNGAAQYYENYYLTDYIRDASLKFIQREQIRSAPFLMVLAPPAPHQPFIPSPKYKGYYKNYTLPKLDNFNVTPKNKHWLLNMSPTPLPESMMKYLNDAYVSRLETLLSVDEMFSDVMTMLRRLDLWENTFVIFTSDNGYHIGQFGQVFDKRQPYESDIRVPLAIKGPGINKKTVIHTPVTNIDLAPTILNLANIPIPEYMDGKIITFKEDTIIDFESRYMLVEYNGEASPNTVSSACPWSYDAENLSQCYTEYDCKCQDSRNNSYTCVRRVDPYINFKYCAFKDNNKFEELYDLQEDPFELTNIADSEFPGVKQWYKSVLLNLEECSGVTCNRPFPNNGDIEGSMRSSELYSPHDYWVQQV